MQNYDVIVIGAGAAGLMCAATAARRGRRVLILDHSVKLAEKIRISGGGRCNFTNVHARAECYLSDNPHFVRSALAQYTPQDFIKLVSAYAIPYHEKTLGQLFCDGSSQQIIDMLDAECKNRGVVRTMGVNIQAVSRSDRYRVETSQGHFVAASLVVATGGLSIPVIGATPFGYRLAEQFGVAVTPLAPALVPLTFHPEDLASFGALAGVSLNCSVQSGHAAFREAVLFTHKGVSGPAILQISSYWQPGETITLDLLPELDAHAWLLEHARSEQLLVTVLAQHWPKRFAQSWVELHAQNQPLRQFASKALVSLAQTLHHWPLRPNGTQGYKKAEVTRGGIDTRMLSSKTMMANQVPGLFFIGEVVDVTGWLGGYNFQWAWSSAYVAGCHC